MKPRPPLLRRKRRLWTFLVRPGRSRFHSAPETARQGRSRFQPAPKTARHGRPRFQPAPKTTRQGRPRFQPAPKTTRQGRPGCPTKLLEQRSGRAGADATAAPGRAVGTCPAITPRTHHPACPLPLRPIAHWCRRSIKCHTHVECTRLSPLTEPPARVRGALRSGDSRDCSTPRRTIEAHTPRDRGRVCPRRVGSIHLVTNARILTRAPPLDAPVDDRKHAHGRLRFQSQFPRANARGHGGWGSCTLSFQRCNSPAQ